MATEERISALRASMEERGVDAYIVPSSDPHQSEYTAEHWKGRSWLSGFTGSAGVLIVTKDHAGLWTDSRYFLQAEQQLASGPVEMHRQEIPHAPEHIIWLADNLKAGSVVGINGYLFSLDQLRHMERYFEPRDIEIRTDLDLLDAIWEERPSLPDDPVFELDVAYTGVSRGEKLALLREEIQDAHADATHYLISTLDDIAWLLNLRGNDVEYNPVFLSYLLVGKRKAFLFTGAEKVPEEIQSSLKEEGIEVKPYDEVEAYLSKLPAKARVMFDPRTLNVRLTQALQEDQLQRGSNLVARMKAIKNDTEIAHIKATMVKDGVALCKLYRWLEALLETQTVTEFELAHQLDIFRRAGGEYHGESFSAIAGYGANGAIVHYRPDKETSAEIAPNGILLLDSGGQYTGGTTDITRTTALSEPTGHQKTVYTLVLKGHISLDTIHFPTGTTGVQLDTLARAPLWRAGKNYGHGTGHGVGFFLNVHEPPQGFAPGGATGRGATSLEPGMLTSNEPGYYENGSFGIRIENLILCIEDEKNEGFLKFETLTLFPIDTTLVDASLLSREEKQWLNDYHATVYERLSPQLNPEEMEWLQGKCLPV